MPIQPIFCPSNHLIFDAARCAQCGWVRPQPPGDGKPLWQPRKLPGSLGGISNLMLPAISSETAVFLLAQAETSYALWGLDVYTGQTRWGPVNLGENRSANALHPDGARILFASIDIAKLMETHLPAMLHALNPQTGQISALWEPGTESLALHLTPAGNRLVMVSSKQELIVLRNQAQPEVIWRVLLPGNTNAAAQVFGGIILITTSKQSEAISFTNTLNAYRLEDGKQLWQQALEKAPHANFAALGEVLLTFENKKTENKKTENKETLTARSLQNGEILWQKENIYAKLYATPIAMASGFWFVRKGKSKQSSEAGYYVLQGMDVHGNEISMYELPVGARPTAISALSTELLLLATEIGQVFCFDTRQHHMVWTWQFEPYQHPQFGAEPDAIQGWALQDGRLLCATRSGQVAILAAGAQPTQDALTPQEYEQRGQTEQAAQAYALQRNYGRAAQLYAQLAQPEKAYALYAHANLWNDAGKLAKGQGWSQRALTAYEKAQNLPEQADLLERQGSWIDAARKYEESGNQRKAMECYENAKDWNQVVRLANQLGDWRAKLAARREMSSAFLVDADEIDQLEEQGKLQEAAKMAADSGYWHQAVDLYERAKDTAMLLKTLEATLTANIKQDWAWQKYLTNLEGQAETSQSAEAYRKLLGALQTYLKHFPKADEYLLKTAEIARRCGDFRTEADLWRELQRPEKAADAFWRAARQAQAKAPSGKLFGAAQKTCAGYYREAWETFRNIKAMENFQECHSQWLQLVEEPWLTMDAKIEHSFKEQGWNTVEIILTNIGRATAQKVQLGIEPTHFELDADSIKRIQTPTQLASHRSFRYTLSLRPRPNEFGEKVPLTIVLRWSGMLTAIQEEPQTIYLPVLSKDDQTGSKPQQHFHVYAGGTVTQIGEQQNVGGNLLKEGAKLVAGSEIHGNQTKTNIQGDQIHGQKGDRMNINRKYGLNAEPAAVAIEMPRCPNCEMPISQPASQFCNECGARLA